MDLTEVGEIGQSQDGLIARCQALEFLSKNEVRSLLRRKVWSEEHPNVYRFVGSSVTWKSRVRAACLARPDACIAYKTAAFSWGLIERQPADIDILVPFGHSPAGSGFVVHRTRNWHDKIANKKGGIPISTPARTIVDISGRVTRETLATAVDTAIVKRIMTFEDLYQELETIGTRGRSRCSLLLGLLVDRDERFEKLDEVSQARWLARFNDAGLPSPTPEYRTPLDAATTAYFDFAFPEQKLAIEVTSWRWHGGPSKFEADIERKAKARAVGWEIVEVSAKTFATLGVAAVRSALQDRTKRSA